MTASHNNFVTNSENKNSILPNNINEFVQRLENSTKEEQINYIRYILQHLTAMAVYLSENLGSNINLKEILTTLNNVMPSYLTKYIKEENHLLTVLNEAEIKNLDNLSLALTSINEKFSTNPNRPLFSAFLEIICSLLKNRLQNDKQEHPSGLFGRSKEQKYTHRVSQIKELDKMIDVLKEKRDPNVLNKLEEKKYLYDAIFQKIFIQMRTLYPTTMQYNRRLSY